MDGNYIKLNRALLDWEWYKDIVVKAVWIHILLKANWKEGKFKGYTIPRGSYVTSFKNLADEVGISFHQARTALEKLESTGEITRKTTNKWQAITVEKYEKWQGLVEECGIQNGNQMATIEERKNIKNKELITYSSSNSNSISIVDRLSDEEDKKLSSLLAPSEYLEIIKHIDEHSIIVKHPFSYILAMAKDWGYINGGI